MVYRTFPTSIPGPSYPIDKQAEPRIKRVEFGDGYTQQAPDGINYNLYTWNLTWESLTKEEKTILEQFLVEHKGYMTFYWVDPEGVRFMVKSRSWTISEFAPRIYKVTTTFNQVPL